MSIQPEGESIRKAVKYISEEKLVTPEVSIRLLIQKACLRFDLTPKDTAFWNSSTRIQVNKLCPALKYFPKYFPTKLQPGR